MEHLPFNLKERKNAYQNSVFNIYFDHLVKDGVSLVKDYLVVEPKIKKDDGISGVAILPIKNNQFGLIKIYRHAVGSFCWEVPRGFIDENETADDAALRELNEETGISTAKENLICLGYVYPEPGIISAKVKIYSVLINENENSEIGDELGHISFDWFSQQDVEKLIEKNIMNDATSQTLYFRYVLNNV